MRIGKRYWRWLRIEGDPRRMPMELDISPSRLGLTLSIAVAGGLILLLGPQAVSFWMYGHVPMSAKLAISIMPALGCLGLVRAFGQLAFRTTARITRTMVEIEKGSIFGRRQWREPLTRYTGVQHLVRHVRRGRHGSVTLQIIELVHPEPDKTVPVMVKEALALEPDVIEAYARALQLPVLVEDSGEIRARDVADLDTPLLSLFRDGRLKTSFDPARPAPDGIAVASTGSSASESRLLLATSNVPVYMVAVGFVVAAAYAATTITDTTALVLAIGLVLTLGTALLYFQQQPRELVISRHSLSYRGMPLIERPFGVDRMSMSIADIEDVRVDTTSGAQALVIQGRKSVLRIGTALPLATLTWLKGFVLERVKKAA